MLSILNVSGSMRVAGTAFLLAALLAVRPAAAGDRETVDDPGGTLNPDEMTLSKALNDAFEGRTSMMVCAQGYLATKAGRHEQARRIFENCAAAGYTGTMTWMAYMEDNGFGRPDRPSGDPAAAAAWDRRAAEAGDPVGQLNHGINLMRGWGVPADEATGRALIDRAAAAGLPTAERLKAHDYDVNEVTPDADEPKYRRVY
ncbi:MAG: sel1 repeat family protein [Pseudomonadota bacterium]